MINPDLFHQANELLSAYNDIVSPSNRQKHIIGEVVTRLKRAEEQYFKIMKSNDTLLSENQDLIETRAFMSDEKLIKILQDQSKNDPELAKFLQKTGGKLVRTRLTEGSAHDMSALDKQPNPQSEEIKSLHLNTEEFYQNLWLIVKKLNQLPLFKNFKPKGVRDVKNCLIEHTDEQNSGAYIFSFGYTSSGPVLRPIKPTGIKAPNDGGLDPNVIEFLNGIVNKLAS